MPWIVLVYLSASILPKPHLYLASIDVTLGRRIRPTVSEPFERHPLDIRRIADSAIKLLAEFASRMTFLRFVHENIRTIGLVFLKVGFQRVQRFYPEY